MKTIIRKILREGLINEGATDILYHFTYLTRLGGILDENKFFLTPVTTSSEPSKGRLYFMSFTRTKTNRKGYGASFVNDGSVRIMVDGKALGNRYKVMPIDYWGMDRTPEMMQNHNTDEMEERIVSNNNEIPNANKYIKRIDLLIKEKGISKDILERINELGIKVNIYNNSKDFASGLDDRTVEPNTHDNKPEKAFNYTSYNMILGALTYKEPEIFKNVLDYFIKLGVDDEGINSIKQGVDKYHEKLNYYLRPNDNYYLTDLNNSLNAELQNSKRNTDNETRHIINLLLNDMKRNNVSTTKEYLNSKIYKGKKNQEQFNKEALNTINNSYNLDDVIKDSLSFEFSDKNGDWYQSGYEYKPVMDIMNSKINIVKNYINNYVSNNNDMYRLNYQISYSEVKQNLDLVSGIKEAFENINIDRFGPEDLIYAIESIVRHMCNVAVDETDRLKEENNTQWRNK